MTLDSKPTNALVPAVVRSSDVLAPRAIQNPVVAELKARSLYKNPLGSGAHAITCPWPQEHTENAKAIFQEPDALYGHGRFSCSHPHAEPPTMRDLLVFLGIDPTQARHKPAIRIVAGELNRVIDAAEQLLAHTGRLFQYGGLIVAVATDRVTGDPAIVQISAPALTRELSVAATWLKYDGRSQEWMESDPSARHVNILSDSSEYAHLPPLMGLARQPYFRENDGTLVMEPGYDVASKRFGVFDPTAFPKVEASLEAAKAALAELLELLSEFAYVSDHDRSAALSGIFTATVRVSLPVAPLYHVRSSVFGTGKTYQCDVISAFSGPGFAEKVSYPITSEEATKVILALLLKNPACVEFDDLDTDLLPHGVIKRMLTAEKISDRILGASKTATVSTRTLFLSSGNNCGAIRDMLRRVITVNLDPGVETPASLKYIGDPLAKLRANRGHYVVLVITIIQAWRAAGMPRTPVDSIATYNGPWSDFCRHPLIWLGLPDPAKSLIEQVQHDPDADTLASLMIEWKKAFGFAPTPVRKAVDLVENGNAGLRDAICEFPVEERGAINKSKLGWLIKKNADRIVGGLAFKKGSADGRTAWAVVEVRSSKPAASKAPFAAASSPVAALPAAGTQPMAALDAFIERLDNGGSALKNDVNDSGDGGHGDDTF